MRKYLSSLVDNVIGDDVLVSGLTLDSREVEPGYLFCAVKGADNDGHDYIQQAIDNGAAALLVEHDTSANLGASYVIDEKLKCHLGHVAAKFYDKPTNDLYVT